jgi:hypothetical protein
MGSGACYLLPFHAQQAVCVYVLAFNTVIYCADLLTSIEIGVGIGHSLLPFTILRYHRPLPIEMTYLFIIAALPVMNSAGITSEVADSWLALATLLILLIWRRIGLHYQSSGKSFMKDRAHHPPPPGITVGP